VNALYLRPTSLPQAIGWLRQHPQARLLAGGQSLLAAMKLGLCEASHLIDVQDLPELQSIHLEDDGQTLWIGARATHARVANNALIRTRWPMLAEMAGHIADPQVREVGTLGGSMAHHDPAACWPAAVLASDARIVTSQRVIAADAFFTGLFETALTRDEVILGVRFPAWAQAGYDKFEHPASRFAMPGVAIVQQRSGQVRVAVTGLGRGVQRWADAETALHAHWAFSALDSVRLPADEAEGDLHASAEYRVHLAQVLARRTVARLHGTPCPPLRPASQARPGARTAEPAVRSAAAQGSVLQGDCVLPASPEQAWQALRDPAVLQACMPGCERMLLLENDCYSASVRVGLGPVSARFESDIQLHPLQAPAANREGRFALDVQARGGALGQASARVDIRLLPHAQGTQLHWQAVPQLQGQLAQLGQRLMHASADRLSALFFARLHAVLSGESPDEGRGFFSYPVILRLRQWWHSLFHR
jgi:CO/xanthine dehydrogenase FAD-binding subunit/carbon monoxide dehydrogenase subunit G